MPAFRCELAAAGWAPRPSCGGMGPWSSEVVATRARHQKPQCWSMMEVVARALQAAGYSHPRSLGRAGSASKLLPISASNAKWLPNKVGAKRIRLPIAQEGAVAAGSGRPQVRSQRLVQTATTSWATRGLAEESRARNACSGRGLSSQRAEHPLDSRRHPRPSPQGAHYSRHVVLDSAVHLPPRGCHGRQCNSCRRLRCPVCCLRQCLPCSGTAPLHRRR